ncbi:Vacuolar protein sorting 24 [Giardia duodenalis]|uniref:Vacuolar protein sorting 24 n=2 Tax=Giardia intestinalis TaxID=5741 RepID=A8BHQ3_GIAIC|nr:Vacuolar protein sorting 24 [Giardia intestinalis]ESU37052.1 Hypothetical protein DHA2_153550 [Giardia intestinalis]KAE8302643.1 Vacuolar protein sorting 24 [Giardia intestinalis]|eukprot:XP_001706906.1 Hypothetical protein GL50803_7323 [Giardia lamblia ATCC 50803]
MGAELSPKATVQQLLDAMKQLQRDSVSAFNKEIREIDSHVSRLQREMREMAKLNYDCSEGMRALAKSCLDAKKVKDQINLFIVQVTSLEREVRLQATQQQIHALIKDSGAVVGRINELFSTNGFREGIVNMSRELERMGIVNSIFNSQFENALQSNDMDARVEAEINDVINKVLESDQASGALPAIPQGSVSANVEAASMNEYEAQ